MRSRSAWTRLWLKKQTKTKKIIVTENQSRKAWLTLKTNEYTITTKNKTKITRSSLSMQEFLTNPSALLVEWLKW
jgi:hypothetical protein